MNTKYVITKEIMAIMIFPLIYFLTEIFISFIVSNVCKVIQMPEKPIKSEQSASFNGVKTGVSESIIIPFETSTVPHNMAVKTSFLNGENAIISSHITEKKTMYPPIIIDDIADSLTDVVNGFLTSSTI